MLLQQETLKQIGLFPHVTQFSHHINLPDLEYGLGVDVLVFFI